MSSKTAAAIGRAIAASNDLVRALEHLSDLLEETDADTTQAVAVAHSIEAQRDLVRSQIARKTQVGTMWK